jgi:O-antigen/teichoic acid export membrane protein
MSTLKASYSKNYVKSLFWQFLSLVSGILSLVIVTPLLAKQPSIYGIYTLVVSFTFFLSYADIGFVGAAVKYVSEAFAKGDVKEEIKIEGFVSFILAVFILIFSAIIFYLSFHPEIILKDLTDVSERQIISRLLIVQALFAPNFILSRLLEIIFGARVEQFFLHRILTAVSLIKIISVSFFINSANYNIVGYYLFSQVFTFLGLIVSLMIARRRYGISIKALLHNFRFSKQTLRQTKKIALNSFYITIVWILFFEIDNVLIAKLLGSQHIAFYMIGFTIISFFRSFFSMIYGPFQSRFNHFIGLNDIAGLKKLYNEVLNLSMPLIVLSITSFVVLAKPLILSWVGSAYGPAVLVGQLLVAGYAVTFITQPTGIILIAEAHVKYVYWISTATLVIFYAALSLAFKDFGLLAFSIAKLAGFVLSGICYTVVSVRRYKLSLQMFKYFLPVFLLHLLLCLLVKNILPTNKSSLNTITVAVAGLLISLISLFVFYMTSGQFKQLIHFKFADLGLRNKFRIDKP